MLHVLLFELAFILFCIIISYFDFLMLIFNSHLYSVDRKESSNCSVIVHQFFLKLYSNNIFFKTFACFTVCLFVSLLQSDHSPTVGAFACIKTRSVQQTSCRHVSFTETLIPSPPLWGKGLAGDPVLTSWPEQPSCHPDFEVVTLRTETDRQSETFIQNWGYAQGKINFLFFFFQISVHYCSGFKIYQSYLSKYWKLFCHSFLFN